MKRRKSTSDQAAFAMLWPLQMAGCDGVRIMNAIRSQRMEYLGMTSRQLADGRESVRSVWGVREKGGARVTIRMQIVFAKKRSETAE